MNQILHHKRRGSMGLVFGVVTLVVLGIVLTLGTIVFFAFSNSLPTGLVTATQQSTINTIVATGASSIVLLEVLLIVAAAGLIISGVFAYMTFGRRYLSPKMAHIAEAWLSDNYKEAWRAALEEVSK